MLMALWHNLHQMEMQGSCVQKGALKKRATRESVRGDAGCAQPRGRSRLGSGARREATRRGLGCCALVTLRLYGAMASPCSGFNSGRP